MNAKYDVERMLSEWMTAGPVSMPDDVVTTVAARISRSPQSVTWRIRSNIVGAPSLAPLALAGLAVALVAVIVFNYLPKTPPITAQRTSTPSVTAPDQSPGDGSTAPATLRPVPSGTSVVAPTLESPSLQPTNAQRSNRPTLGPGTYRSSSWRAGLTYTVPIGWVLEADDPVSVVLSPSEDPSANVELLYNVYPPDLEHCTAQVDWTSPHTAQDLVASITSRADWSGTAAPVDLGGLSGWRLGGDLGDSCDYVYTVRGWDGIPGSSGGSGHNDLYALDDPAGATIAVVIRGDDDFVARAEALIATFEFASPVPRPPPSTGCPAPASPLPSGLPQRINVSITLEQMFWAEADGSYQFVVVATNESADSSAPSAVSVQLFDECSNRRRNTVYVNGLAAGKSMARVGTIDSEGFVPVRMEAIAYEQYVGHVPMLGQCTQTDFRVNRDGAVVTSGEYSVGYLVETTFDAVVVYRDAEGLLIGANGDRFDHDWREGHVTDFALSDPAAPSGVTSTELYCTIVSVRV